MRIWPITKIMNYKPHKLSCSTVHTCRIVCIVIHVTAVELRGPESELILDMELEGVGVGGGLGGFIQKLLPNKLQCNSVHINCTPALPTRLSHHVRTIQYGAYMMSHAVCYYSGHSDQSDCRSLGNPGSGKSSGE